MCVGASPIMRLSGTGRAKRKGPKGLWKKEATQFLTGSLVIIVNAKGKHVE